LRIKLNKPETKALRNILTSDGEIERERVHVLPWGRGVGKSWFIRLLWWLLISRWDGRIRPGARSPGIRIVVAMPSYRQAKAVHFREILTELYGEWKHLGGTLNRSTLEISFPGGSSIRWVTAENPVGARGLRCDVAFFDEADDIPIDMYDAVCVPWFTEPHSFNVRVLCGTPMRGRGGLLYREYDAAKRGVDGYYAVHATYLDAPSHANIERAERARENMPDAWFRREYLCDFDAAEGLVYPEFSREKHIVPWDKSKRPNEWICGADFGSGVPSCYLAIAYDGVKCHVVREVYKAGMRDEELASIARTWSNDFPRAKWYADYAWPNTMDYVRRHGGINMVNADKSVEDGILTVGSWIHRDRLLIDPSCKNLIEEIQQYRWTTVRNQDGLFKDKPDKKKDHAVDALRYAIFTRFGRPPAMRIEL
jgi:hypothetical protein